MPVININSFDGGMNNKINPTLLAPNVGTNVINVDPSSKTLRPMSGISANPSNREYYFNGVWESDTGATSGAHWQEYDGYLYHTPDGLEVKPRRKKAGGSEKDMGVIAPSGSPSGAVGGSSYNNKTVNPCYIIKTETDGGTDLPGTDDGTLRGRVIIGRESGSTAKIDHFIKDGTNWWIYLKECYGWTIVEDFDVYSNDLSTIDYDMKISPGYKPYRDIVYISDASTYDDPMMGVDNYIQPTGNSQRFKDSNFYRIKGKLGGGSGDSGYGHGTSFRGLQLATHHLGAGGEGGFEAGPYLYKPGVTSIPFQLKITAVDSDGFESAPSDASAEITLETASQYIDWSGLPTSSDASSYKHYRTGGISSVYKLNESKTNSNNYSDSTWESQLTDEPPNSNHPPITGLKYLIEVNGVMFAAKDSKLYASRVGYPNAWPLLGYLPFDHEITGLGKLSGELVVFTQNQAYRVRGTDPEALVKSKILGEQGVPSGYDHTIVNVGKLLIFLSNDGLCTYDGISIQVLTSSVLADYAPNLANPRAAAMDNIYYCLTSTGNGYIINAQNGLNVYRTSMNATSLHYIPNLDQLWSNEGQIGVGPYLPVTYHTAEFVGNDPSYINSRKVFSRFEISYRCNTSGTISLKQRVNGDYVNFANGTQTHTLTSTGNAQESIFIYLNNFQIGYTTQLEITTTDDVEIYAIRVHYEHLEGFINKMEFVTASVFYTGSVDLTIEIDSLSVETASLTGGSNPSTDNLSINTQGNIPHFYQTGGDGKIIDVFFHAKEI